MPTLYKIRGFTPKDSAITLYTHKLWHRRYFLNREVPYWLQSSITGSAFRGLLLILQNNFMLTDTKRRRLSGILDVKLSESHVLCVHYNVLPILLVNLLVAWWSMDTMKRHDIQTRYSEINAKIV